MSMLNIYLTLNKQWKSCCLFAWHLMASLSMFTFSLSLFLLVLCSSAGEFIDWRGDEETSSDRCSPSGEQNETTCFNCIQWLAREATEEAADYSVNSVLWTVYTITKLFLECFSSTASIFCKLYCGTLNCCKLYSLLAASSSSRFTVCVTSTPSRARK